MFTPQKKLPSDEDIHSMDNEEREQFISDYYNGAFKHAGYKPKFIAKMKYRFGNLVTALIGIAGIAIVFLVLNGILVGTQYLYDGDDKKQLNKITELMDKEKVIIEMYERKKNLSKIERDDYTRRLGLYNGMVPEFNELTEKVNTTWYLIPGLKGSR